MIRIIVGGDICPMGIIQDAFIKGNADKIFHDLLEEIDEADLSIANLECPLISHETPITNKCAILGADPKCIHGFASAKWDILNLANNHSFDHGAKGLLKTINTIKKAGLSVLGAGSNIKEAQTPFIKEINGERIVIYSMAEREFSIASEKTPGANPLDIINFTYSIQQYKQQGIFIVLIHGGKEYYSYPSPEMVKRCRFMIDMGADAVICCHTHCALPWETYANRPIVYGLGNLIFEDPMQTSNSWYEGYLARLSIQKKQISFEAIPYFQSKPIPGTQKMDETAEKHFFNEMKKKSNHVKDSVFLEDRWVEYCRQQKDTYLSMLFGYNKPMHKLRRLILPRLHSKEALLRALLLVQCETHHEILNTIFSDERSKE